MVCPVKNTFTNGIKLETPVRDLAVALIKLHGADVANAKR